MRLIRRILNNLNRSVYAALVAAFATAIAVVAPTSVASAAIAITPSDYYGNFNGTDQGVETQTAIIPTSGDFSVEAWAYNSSTNNANTGTIVSQGTTNAGGAFFISSEANSWNIRVGSWNPVYTNTTIRVTFPLNQWFHIAVVQSASGNSQKLYINGELVASTTGVDIIPETSNLRIGRMYGSFNEYWK